METPLRSCDLCGKPFRGDPTALRGGSLLVCGGCLDAVGSRETER